MIYLCVPAYNEASTVGLLLWKVRQVFRSFPREYHLLVADDGSDDATHDVLTPYARVLPLTLVRHPVRMGYAASLEELLTLALRRTDRPKRDCAVTMHADFSHDPAVLPELVRRIESGADLVVGEVMPLPHGGTLAERVLRRTAGWCLAGAVGLDGVRDVVSGYCAYRLSALRPAFRDSEARRVLALEGWAANAEILRRVRPHARRVEAVPVPARPGLRRRARRRRPLARLADLLKARPTVRGIAA